MIVEAIIQELEEKTRYKYCFESSIESSIPRLDFDFIIIYNSIDMARHASIHLTDCYIRIFYSSDALITILDLNDPTIDIIAEIMKIL